MSTVSLRLPDSLHETARTLAKREDVSLNQLIALALAEKVSALGVEEILVQRARRGDRSKFLAALDKAPDVEEDAEGRRKKTVEEVLAGQRDAVERYTRELMNYLQDEDIVTDTTETKGGDLRFKHANGIYAEIVFYRTRDEVDLRLYFAPDANPGRGFRLFQRTSKQSKHDVRLNALEPIPDKVKKLIETSRRFMRGKREA